MENNCRFQVLPKRQRELFDRLSRQAWLADFYLAGGTALALQISHRQSIDFDFFTSRSFDAPLLKKRLNDLGQFELFSESTDTINGQLNSVQISFFNLPYHLIAEPQWHSKIKIASAEDIAAMKLAAISSRGSKKDFIDLYFLLKDFPLSDMIRLFVKKYGEEKENIYCVLKGLVYFADADEQPMPKMIKRITWATVKRAIKLAHKQYLTGLSKE